MSCNIIISEETINILKDMMTCNDFNKFNGLMRSGEKIKEKTTWKLLHVATSLGYHEVVEFLIQNGAAVDSTLELRYPEPGFTPLHIAAQRNRLECARILLKYGASVFSKIESVCDPIYLAVFYGHVEMAALLLDHGANVNARVDNKFFEKTRDHLLEFDFLGEKMHHTLWQDHKLPLLHCSILKKFDEITKLLLDRGADIDLKTSLGKTTLMQAVEVNNDKLVQYLITERNANVNDRDIFGKPVIHFIMLNANRIISPYSKIEYEQKREKKRILEILMSNGANVNVRFPADVENSYVIHYVIRYGFSVGIDNVLYLSDLCARNINLSVSHLCKINPEYLTPDIENDLNYLQVLQRSFENILYDLATFAISRRMVGLPYDENLISEYAKSEWLTNERYTKEMNDCENEINGELNCIKHTMIGATNVTIYHLLTCTKNQLYKLMSQKRLKISEFMKNYLEKNLIFYYWELLRRVNYGNHRITYSKECTEFLSNLFINQLPMDCCEIIVSYFDDETLFKWGYLLSDNKI